MPSERRHRQHSRPWNADEARGVLAEWKQSGVTIAEFSRKRGLVPERLYLWRKRFATETTEPRRALALVPATIISTNAELVIRLPNDVTIEVENPSPTWIAAVVRELTRSSS
jgi:transposase-like protein